ncbi:hypothetical protein [Pedosphaera parvula]|uniref:Uncharacterized protein n=1 Tax=Pedosphaera parvula (strain Ellin514) TaxID=320771 RepID=B9XIW0_PEDPL|nr:hypothetical protein [Pedosphaera parvula]EEF60187.1 hypothetical protein Cflav_PD3246 [Pedosphaera parvula Ellin514]
MEIGTTFTNAGTEKKNPKLWDKGKQSLGLGVGQVRLYVTTR